MKSAVIVLFSHSMSLSARINNSCFKYFIAACTHTLSLARSHQVFYIKCCYSIALRCNSQLDDKSRSNKYYKEAEAIYSREMPCMRHAMQSARVDRCIKCQVLIYSTASNDIFDSLANAPLIVANACMGFITADAGKSSLHLSHLLYACSRKGLSVFHRAKSTTSFRLLLCDTKSVGRNLYITISQRIEQNNYQYCCLFFTSLTSMVNC
jgi:hypothetical protein